MVGPERTQDNKQPTFQPPRPPNAWILFRAEMSRQMPPGKRAQSDISKQISAMWSNLDPETKAQYERRAEQKKAEHAIKFPNYRFMPKKKEEKERIREEKKMSKRRKDDPPPMPHPAHFPPMPMHPYAPHAYMQMMHYPMMPQMPIYYNPAAYYGTMGPSPPMSAAGSPETSKVQEGEAAQTASTSKLEPTEPPPMEAAPSPQAQQPLLMPTTSVAATPEQHPLQQQHQEDYELLNPQVAPSPLASTPSTWVSSDAVQNPQTPAYPDFVNFDIPHNDDGKWIEDAQFRDSMHAFLTATGDPSIFEMSFDKQDGMDFTLHPGEIDLSLTSGDLGLGDLPDFTNFDFSQLNAQTPHETPPTLQESVPPHYVQPSSASYSAQSYDADDYLIFDDNNSPEFPQPSPSSSATPPSTSSAKSSPYVPPSGAAYSSKRRVGGSWRAPYAVHDSSLEPGPSRSWSVPATPT